MESPLSRLAFAPEERRRLLRRALLLLLGAVLGAGVVAAVGVGFEEAESQYAMQRNLERLHSIAMLLSIELEHELQTLPRDALIATSPAVDAETRSLLGARFVGLGAPGEAPQDGTFRARIPSRPGFAEVAVDVRLRDLVHAADELDSPDEHVFVRPPGAPGFVDLHGAPAGSPALEDVVGAPDGKLVLPADDAVKLGLPPFEAFASVARVDAGPLGTWLVGIARSARSEVERDRRGIVRVLLKVAVTGVVVALFGLLAFRDYRSELLARHELALAEQRRSDEEALARANRTATMLTLASGVAHELGTPLGLVQVKAEGLRDALADTPEEDDARTILAQVHRLREVVQGFLRVARGGTPHQESVAPVGLAHTARDLVAHRFEAAGVHLEVVIDPDLPRLGANRLLVEQALVNLLINACDAAPAGSTVDLRVRRDGGAVLFEVLDEGEGVAEQDQEILLAPFFSRKEHGTGLGLAITHEIARMHHGEVTLRPRPTRGAVATLRLPGEAA